MKLATPDYWDKLQNEFPEELVVALRELLDTTGPVGVRAASLAAPIDVEPGFAERLLERVASDGYLVRETQYCCPGCGETIPKEDLERTHCPVCKLDFEHEGRPEPRGNYTRSGLRSRDIRWLITIHGVNTRGAWQETFSWELAKLNKRAMPVAIYKYGRLVLRALFPWGQQRSVERLRLKLNSLLKEMEAEGYGSSPDVIAHSFGTWLLWQALLADKDITLGRIILTGSIVPPDFNWGPLLGKQVEAVLCHYGGRDWVVRFAQFGIGRSGPSGRYGFNKQKGVYQKYEPCFGHSDYFADAHFLGVLRDTWGAFLTRPSELLNGHGDLVSKLATWPWRSSPMRVIGCAIKYILLAALLLAVMWIVHTLWLGGGPPR